ncbi:hypothetical protein AXA84_0206 [Candidatus Phytoplasma oryzae]|uniref:Pentapeptide repeats family protein n=1 Tax=Candidatus Phytoplasma oryzae TaxID=203274 RepID=A0A139JQL1_9MOLU|nr:hypothetical protein [Candidatus Phytoplasma oryzae]KXT29259.1 hypothetical protein AXA84_0206 [Candidatus Phytoplasma oryzae]RAM57843.1 hypothetical protein DH96_00750 [Candidatus Phytoplasma oryzae]
MDINSNEEFSFLFLLSLLFFSKLFFILFYQYNSQRIDLIESEIQKNSILIDKIKLTNEQKFKENISLLNENHILNNYLQKIIKDNGTKEYYSLKNKGNIIKKKYINGNIEQFDQNGIKFLSFNKLNNKWTLFKDSQYNVKDFLKMGFSPQILKDSNFKLKELRYQGGLELEELKKINYQNNLLKIKDLKEADFTSTELQKNGFNINEIYQIFAYSNEQLNELGIL